MHILSRILLLSFLHRPRLSANAQRTNKEIKQRQNELQKLRDDIQAYENKLKESEKKRRSRWTGSMTLSTIPSRPAIDT